jgi:hypothetical protein
MDVSGLFMGCIAGSYLKYLSSFFLLPLRVEFPRRTVTLGRKLGEGGAADVFLATADVMIPGSTSEQFALKKV